MALHDQDRMDDYGRAVAAIRRRMNTDGPSFRSSRAALRWYFEARDRMQSPVGLHPRGEVSRNGERVFLRVDGGKGGDLDGVLVTLSTIGTALRHLAMDYPQDHGLLVRAVRDGSSTRDLAKISGLSQATISRKIGQGESYVAGALAGSGVLR